MEIAPKTVPVCRIMDPRGVPIIRQQRKKEARKRQVIDAEVKLRIRIEGIRFWYSSNAVHFHHEGNDDTGKVMHYVGKRLLPRQVKNY